MDSIVKITPVDKYDSSIERRLSFLYLGIILSIGAFFRFYKLRSRGVWLDEVETWYSAMSGSIHSLDAPLVRWTNQFFMLTSNRNDIFILHLTTACLGVASIYLAWVLGKNKIFKHRSMPYVCSFLVAFSPYHIFYSQEARPYSLFVFFSLCAYLFFLQAVASEKKRSWSLFFVFFILTLMTHAVALSFAAGFGAYFILRAWREINSKQFSVILGSLPFALFITYSFSLFLGLYWLVFRPKTSAAPASLPDGTYQYGFAQYLQNYMNNLSGVFARPTIQMWLFVPAILLLGMVLYSLFQMRKKQGHLIPMIFLATLTTNASALYFTLGEMSNWPWSRYTVPSFVPVLFLLSYGCIQCFKKFRVTGVCLTILYLCFLSFGLTKYFKNQTYDRSAGMRVIADYLEAHRNQLKGVLIDSEYYGYRLTSHYFLFKKENLPFFDGSTGVVKKVNLKLSTIRSFKYPVIEKPVASLRPGTYAVLFDGITSCLHLSVGASKPLKPIKLVITQKNFGLALCVVEPGSF